MLYNITNRSFKKWLLSQKNEEEKMKRILVFVLVIVMMILVSCKGKSPSTPDVSSPTINTTPPTITMTWTISPTHSITPTITATTNEIPIGVNTSTITQTCTISPTHSITPTITLTATATSVETPIGGNYIIVYGDGVDPEALINVQKHESTGTNPWDTLNMKSGDMWGINYFDAPDYSEITANPEGPPGTIYPTAWVRVEFYKNGLPLGTTITAHLENFTFNNSTAPW